MLAILSSLGGSRVLQPDEDVELGYVLLPGAPIPFAGRPGSSTRRFDPVNMPLVEHEAILRDSSTRQGTK